MSKKEMTTEKRLKVRLYLSLLVYTVVGYGLTLILDYIFSKFDNGIFAWLYWRLDLLFILYLMLGFICIFNYYWKKPWGYLDEVIDATQTVYEQNNHTVSLSEPLKELEEQLNQITILPSAGIGMQNNFLYQLADFNYLNIGGMSFWTPHVILISAGIELFVFTFLAIHSYCRHQVA